VGRASRQAAGRNLVVAAKIIANPDDVNSTAPQEDSFMHMKVMKEQFVLDGDKLTHTPTGATFWLGEKDLVACEQGRLNLDTGDDYDLDELKEEAWRIMAAERKARSGITDSHF